MKPKQKCLLISLICLMLFIHQKAVAGIESLGNATCQKEYLDIFSREEINMTLAFGYDDISETTTNDLASLNLFIKTLTAKCSVWDQRMCGFKILSKSPHVLVKKFFGPDGKPRTLKITADASSVSSDDKANRLNPLQKIQSENMKQLFVNGLQNSEVTIYMGHSRDGGGPSFEPAKLLSNGHVNYSYYHKNKKDKHLMVNALAKTPNKSRIVALISCSSIRWFSRSIESSAPSSGIIGTNEAFYTGNFKEVFPLMEQIFSYNCLKDFKIDDAAKASQILTNKHWKVSESSQKISKAELDKRTLETLASYLRHDDINIRREAFLEIKSYDSRLYTPVVWKELKAYSFGNTLGKNF